MGPQPSARISEEFWRNRRVFVTGHTGFKGSWLCSWLISLGAEVHGLALDPPTKPALYDQLGLGDKMASDTRVDIADAAEVLQAIDASNSEVVFHLAAQPLVREAYADPVGTMMTNVMGTAHVLEALRQTPTVGAAVIITTDKVYENPESGQAFGESDPLGGHDPYSASKAATEIVTQSYARSFFPNANHRTTDHARFRPGGKCYRWR